MHDVHDPPRAHDAQGETNPPTTDRDHHGLDQKLGEYLPTGGAEGLSDPDLAHPFGERGEHDIGDDDAAHEQRDDAAGEEGEVVDHALLVALVDALLAVPDPEVLDAVARTQEQLERLSRILVRLG